MTEARVAQLRENRGNPSLEFESLKNQENVDGYSQNQENHENHGNYGNQGNQKSQNPGIPESSKTWVDDDQTVKNPTAIVPVTFEFESPMGPRQETNLIKLLQSSRNLNDCENGYFKNNKFEENNFVDTVGKSSFLKFKENWSDWVETEVVESSTDWDKLINAT
jgi:hypothetical protein